MRLQAGWCMMVQFYLADVEVDRMKSIATQQPRNEGSLATNLHSRPICGFGEVYFVDFDRNGSDLTEIPTGPGDVGHLHPRSLSPIQGEAKT